MLWKVFTGSSRKPCVNRPTWPLLLPHSARQFTYSFQSVDGGVGKYGILALRVTADVVQEQRIRGRLAWKSCRSPARGFCRTGSLFSAETGEL